MVETLNFLREVEQSARAQQEQARHDASSMRAAVPGEIEALREEKNRRLLQEKRRLDSAARREAEATREALAADVDEKMRALRVLEPWLEEKTVALLRSLMSKG